MSSDKAHLCTWISAELKARFSDAAARQNLSDSALLKRLIEQMLATVPEGLPQAPSPASREARLTIRLVPDDRVLLHERARARGIPDATYISILVRSHLWRVVPIPERELADCRFHSMPGRRST